MEIEIAENFDIECYECGNLLQATEHHGTITVSPCEDCLQDSYKAGKEDGIEIGEDNVNG